MYDLPLRHLPEAVSRGNEQFALELVFSGGTGARPDLDGLSATAFPSGVWGSQVETTEAVAPVLITRRELKPDSGGPGRMRGGLGQHIEITSSKHEDFLLFLSVERVLNPAQGRFGGSSGAAGKPSKQAQKESLVLSTLVDTLGGEAAPRAPLAAAPEGASEVPAEACSVLLSIEAREGYVLEYRAAGSASAHFDARALVPGTSDAEFGGSWQEGGATGWRRVPKS